LVRGHIRYRFPGLLDRQQNPSSCYTLNRYEPSRAMLSREATSTPNPAMGRTSGSFGSFLSMKFHPQPAAPRLLASRRSSYSR
jgi:hypothetical protein